MLVGHVVKDVSDRAASDAAADAAAEEAAGDVDLWVRTCAGLASNTVKVLEMRGTDLAALVRYSRLGASITDTAQEAIILRAVAVLTAFAEGNERVDDLLGAASVSTLSRFSLLGGLVNLAGDAYLMPV